jgi:hypothetical protein
MLQSVAATFIGFCVRNPFFANVSHDFIVEVFLSTLANARKNPAPDVSSCDADRYTDGKERNIDAFEMLD